MAALVPVLAETESLRTVVDALVDALGVRLSEVRIVLSPAAPAESRAVCAELEARHRVVKISEQRRGPGLGWAVRQGIAEAQGAFILMIDGDGEMDVATVPHLVAAIESEGADMAVASRWIEGGGAVGYAPVKLVLNRGFQIVFRRLYRTDIHDLTLGFKLARTEVLRGRPWIGEFHEIACETTLRVIRDGYEVVEVPTVWRRRSQGSSSNPFRRNFRYVRVALAVLVGARSGWMR